MSRQVEALKMLLTDELFQRLLGPVFDAKGEMCHFDRIPYGVLSGGERAAISWAYAIWEDRRPPTRESDTDWKEWPGYLMRDPFEGFGVMDWTRQQLVLEAYAWRWDVPLEQERWMLSADAPGGPRSPSLMEEAWR